ncbi:MAG: hypothetical protein XD40_0831 [Archaeoglobus fulgidus]|uniref:Uncharacterized protein n=1 Tax=Archaeoglobus fulgidus TaxID=2234 RepID=A0A101E0X2_ARCFL|nr:hypothetical protein [Archaeoglobus fulgidus]KUJ94010.1 MAG: hypothetical protein XD40_0831 [Archaeoglobus fulgidus]KUK07040.1 MAG: Uncharacterized protein XD48_0752 [Archaeoglobus fulgidus]
MRCPHCGQYLENTLWEALQPYRSLNLPVVVTNIDSILEVGPRIRAIFEEKNGHLKIRGFQAVTLKKVARSLRVPLYYIERLDDQVKLYEFDTNQAVESGPFLRADQLLPIFSGSVNEFGDWIMEKFVLPSCSSVNGGKTCRRW